MNHLKKTIISVLLISTMLLSACGSKENGKPALANAGNDSGKVYTVKISYENQPGEPVDLAAKEWQKLAEEKSNGKLKLELYPSSQLGSKTDVVEQAEMGSNVIQITDASFLMDSVPDIGILSAPYLTDNFDQLLKLTDSEWFKGLSKELENKGLHIISTKWIYGERHLITKKPVTKPADLKGMKIRVPNNQMAIKTIEKMGATPTPMPLGDVYPAIAQGVIDGMENPLSVIFGSKVHENAKFISLTGHMQMLTQWVAGQKYVETLPPEILKTLQETSDEAGKFVRKKVEESDKKVLDDFKAAGVKVNEADRTAFSETTKSIYGEFKQWSPGLYDKVQQIISGK